VGAAGSAPGGDFVSRLLGGSGGVGGNLTGLVGSVLSVARRHNACQGREKERRSYAKFGYGGVYAGKHNPFGIPSSPYEVPQPRYYYDKASNDGRRPPTAAGGLNGRHRTAARRRAAILTSSKGRTRSATRRALQPNVSPEEQQEYEEFVLAGMALIYDKEGEQRRSAPAL
jgi:hypothetical protein